jgi:hypothetical protein
MALLARLLTLELLLICSISAAFSAPSELELPLALSELEVANSTGNRQLTQNLKLVLNSCLRTESWYSATVSELKAGTQLLSQNLKLVLNSCLRTESWYSTTVSELKAGTQLLSQNLKLVLNSCLRT